jgi:hypothetical protein
VRVEATDPMINGRFRRMALLALFEVVLVSVTIAWDLVGLWLALVPVLLITLLNARRRAKRTRRVPCEGMKQSKREPARVPGVVPQEVESDFWDAQPLGSTDWAKAEPDLAGSDGVYRPPAFDEPTATPIAYYHDGDQIRLLNVRVESPDVIARQIPNHPRAQPVTPRPLHWRNPDAGASPLPSWQARASLARRTKNCDRSPNRELRWRAESADSRGAP